jgi:UDP-glucose 4-epimerase
MLTEKLVVVTGGAGFIGSRLCARLIAGGNRVISLDNYFAGSRENHVPGVEYREGHTKDIAVHIPETPDILYHLGEYARVEQSLLEPDLVRDLNTVGTRAVVEFWKAKKCKLVYAGSSTKFGDEGRAREATPYASTKAANTELVKRVGDAEGLPYAITYFYNVYGPGERAGIYGTVIEAYRQMYLHGEPLAVTAPGTQLRNFTHVDDIVDGLVLVGELGQGDEYGLGNERTYSILDVAKLFGGEFVMLPARAGNRMQSGLDASKSRALGWKTTRSLEQYIADFVASHPRGAPREKRVLVFSTTFYPTVGPAEETLIELIRQMPDVRFDIVTTAFTRGASRAESPLPNARIHRVGFGRSFDKYLLPILGAQKAAALHRAHSYLFTWSLMASYAALAGVLLKRVSRLPLLITLADQNIARVSLPARFVLRMILTDADQVYGVRTQEAEIARVTTGTIRRHSIGEGDAFANQLRYSYAEILRLRQDT